MIYITGDTHGDFRNVERFCKKMQTSKDDVLIILGDAGTNYYGSEQDKRKKKYLESLPITIFAIHVISMPEKDEMVLEEICKGYKIKIEDLVRQFYLWVMREPEAAAQWLNGEAENKKV